MGVFLVESGADVNARNGFGTTPIDAAYADNSFASGEDLDALNENRAFLRDYLRARGGKSGQPPISLLEAIDQDDADVVREHMESGTDPNEAFIPPEFPFAGGIRSARGSPKEQPGDREHSPGQRRGYRYTSTGCVQGIAS